MVGIVVGEYSIDNVNLVMFDKDGTLIDIHHYWVSMIKIRALRIVDLFFSGYSDKKTIYNNLLESMGVELLTDRIKKEGPVGIKSRIFIVNVVSDVIRSQGLDITNEHIEELFAEVDLSTSQDMLPLLKLLPGSLNLLKKLKSCGVKIAVVSTDITSRTQLAMETLQLTHFFTEILGGDSVKNTKPAPDLALQVIQKCECTASNAVVIGDHPVDIKMGQSAGVGLNIGVLTGLSDATLFKNLRCAVVHDLTNIDVRC